VLGGGGLRAQARRRGRARAYPPIRGVVPRIPHLPRPVSDSRGPRTGLDDDARRAGGLMTQRLTGKRALVTGSSRGIGRAIAQRLAAEGATVVVTARDRNPSPSIRDGQTHLISGSLTETVELIEAAGGRALAIPADLEDPEQRADLIERAVTALDGLDILVNNAGFADYSRIETMSDATFQRTVRHYLEVPFVLSRAAIPHLRAGGAGWIVNIGS